MCDISQMANESDLQLLIKVTGVTQLETKKCGDCDVSIVRPVIMDDTTEAEHVGLYHYYQWNLCGQCRRREESNLSRVHAGHIAAHSYLGDKDCNSGNCGAAWDLMDRNEGRSVPRVYQVEL